jgi:DNA-binding GntR family transcriptional regulator
MHVAIRPSTLRQELARDAAAPLVTNANVAVGETIRRAIIRGDLAPGDRLREGDVAHDLGVSRTPVREAFLTLRAEGLLELMPSRGARVRGYELEELGVLYDLRKLLEGYAAGSAAARIEEAVLAELDASCDRLESLAVGDVAAHHEENIVFHSTILDAVGSDRLSHIVRTLLELPLPYKGDYWSSPANKRASETSHRRIVEALRARDASEARVAMTDHLAHAGALIMDGLRRAQQPAGA